MKKLNVKKLVAIGVGAALVGSALAPVVSAKLGLQKSDIVNATTGQPLWSVVTGGNAAVSDAVWAGNIATRIAQLATKETPVKVTGGSEGTGKEVHPTGLNVDLGIGGKLTYTSGAKSFETANMSSASSSKEYTSMARMGNGQLDFLNTDSKTYIFSGTTYDWTPTEYVWADPDMLFQTTGGVADLILELGSHDFNYTLDFGSSGIPYDDDLGSGFGTFTNSSNDNIVIPFLGDQYIVNSASSTQVELTKTSGTITYFAGQEFVVDGKGKYKGQKLTVKVESIFQTQGAGTFQANIGVYDADGQFLTSEDVSASDYINQAILVNGKYAIETSIKVDTVGQNVETTETFIRVSKGDSIVVLKDNKGYPYDSTDTSSSQPWKVDLQTTTTGGTPDVNRISKIVIYNDTKKWEDEDGLRSSKWSFSDGPKEAVFLEGLSKDTLGYGFVKVVFDGFKSGESTSKIQIGGDYTVDSHGHGLLKYKDNQSVEREIPLWIKLQDVSQGNFMIDNQKYTYKFVPRTGGSTADSNFVLGADSNTLNGEVIGMIYNPVNSGLILGTDTGDANFAVVGDNNAVDINGNTYLVQRTATAKLTFQSGGYFRIAAGEVSDLDNLYASTPASSKFIGASGAVGSSNVESAWFVSNDNPTATNFDVFDSTTGVALGGGSDKGSNLNDTYRYAFGSTSAKDLVLMLDSDTVFDPENSHTLSFSGTSTSATETPSAPNVGYYIPDTELGDQVPGVEGDGTYYVAQFQVGDGLGTISTWLNTTNNKLFGAGNSISDLSGLSADANWTNGSLNHKLKFGGTGTIVKKAYTDWGSLIDISDEKTTVITMPQNRRYAKFTVRGQATAQEREGGETFEGVVAKETVTTSDGVEITVSGINYTPGVGTGTGNVKVEPANVMTVVNAGSLVKTDSSAFGGGNKVIVGGYKVNNLARNVTLSDGSSLEDVLTSASSAYVLDRTSSGDIVAAGYTADQTGQAAQALINELEALLA